MGPFNDAGSSTSCQRSIPGRKLNNVSPPAYGQSISPSYLYSLLPTAPLPEGQGEEGGRDQGSARAEGFEDMHRCVAGSVSGTQRDRPSIWVQDWVTHECLTPHQRADRREQAEGCLCSLSCLNSSKTALLPQGVVPPALGWRCPGRVLSFTLGESLCNGTETGWGGEDLQKHRGDETA